MLSPPTTRCGRLVVSTSPVLQSGGLGSEDLQFGRCWAHGRPSASGLNRIVYGYEVDFEGTGEILKWSRDLRTVGVNLDIDPTNGYINNEEFVATPSSYVIQRTGDHPGLSQSLLTMDPIPGGRRRYSTS